MLKIAAVIVLVTILFAQEIIAEEEEDFVCQEDTAYVLDDQFPCQCPPETNNTLTCDLSRCQEKPAEKQKCNLGAKWTKECNTCWCRVIGIVCSKDDCKPS